MITSTPEHRALIERRLGISLQNGQVLGDENSVLAFANYTGSDIEIFMVTRGLTRRLIQCGFLYAFEFCGCHRATVRVALSNTRSQDIVERLGFVREGRLRQAHKGEDVLIYGMLRSECRWINEQKKHAGRAAGSRHRRDAGDSSAAESHQ